MSTKQAAPAADEQQTPEQILAAWADEARAKASDAIAAGESMSHGAILPTNPALEYRVIDGDLPASKVAGYRNKFERLGYRDVTSEVQAVIGYDRPIVYAIPKAVYREVLRPAWLRRLNDLRRRWGLGQPHIHRPADLDFD